MAKSYVEKMRQLFGFLEEYGFSLTNDPFNPERLCYQNEYGEIVIWFDHFLLDYSIYVQINGWKKDINLNEEYKNCIGKSPLFVSLKKKFKKIFEFYYYLGKDFFGLKINKNKEYKPKELKVDSSYNPFKNWRSSKFVSGFVIFFMIVMFCQLILFIFLYDTKHQNVFNFMENVLYYSTILFYSFSLITISRKFDIVSRILATIYPIILIFELYFLTRREILMINLIYLGILLLNLIINLLLLIKHKTPLKLAGCTLILIYPFFSTMIQSNLTKYFVYSDNFVMTNFIIIGLILGIIVLIIYLIKVRSKYMDSKKEYIGGMLASFFVPIVIMLFPAFIVEDINYAFDKSEPIEYTYQIVDKEEHYSSGRYSSGYNYYLILNSKENGKIHVHRITYESFDVGDTIKLNKHTGFLDIEYYEYTSEELSN